jgi:hypothetical protein
MKNSYKSYEHIRTVCLNWGPDESLLLLADKVKRTVADETPEAPPTPTKPASQATPSSSTSTFTSFFKRTATRDLEPLVSLAEASDSVPPSPVKEKKGVVHFLYPPETTHILSNGGVYSTISEDLGLLNHTTCTYFATHYRLYDLVKTFGELCDCNSDVASQIGRFHVATSWQMIKLLCENVQPQQKTKKSLRKANTLQDLKIKITENEDSNVNALAVSDSFQDLTLMTSSLSTDDLHVASQKQQQHMHKSNSFSFFPTEIEPAPKSNILDDILPSVPFLPLTNPPSYRTCPFSILFPSKWVSVTKNSKSDSHLPCPLPYPLTPPWTAPHENSSSKPMKKKRLMQVLLPKI